MKGRRIPLELIRTFFLTRVQFVFSYFGAVELTFIAIEVVSFRKKKYPQNNVKMQLTTGIYELLKKIVQF